MGVVYRAHDERLDQWRHRLILDTQTSFPEGHRMDTLPDCPRTQQRHNHI